MKTIILSLIAIIVFYSTCEMGITVKQPEPPKIIAKTADTINFKAHIQPILEKRCSPCHFTGGKMYARMPFDSASTILSHEAGILKRIKDEQENALIKNFIHTNSK